MARVRRRRLQHRRPTGHHPSAWPPLLLFVCCRFPGLLLTHHSRPAASSLDDETPNVGFMLQAWEEPQYTGDKTRVYTEEGFYDFPFMAWSYVWFPNKTDCCLTFCASPTNHTPTGWWCDHRRRPKTDKSFGRVNIWCGRGSNTSNQRKCNETQAGGQWDKS